MKNVFKTNFLICGFCLLAILCAFLFGSPFTAAERIEASADTGPKPSVRVTFENMGDELCYATLLSKNPSTGPARAWDGTEDGKDIFYAADETVWRAFADYEDPDGFYFLQWFWRADEYKTLNWTYYPPQVFKILLYYPERKTNDGAAGNAFCTSDVLERYAFHSYFSVDMRNVQSETISTSAKISATKSYDYSAELPGFFVRLFATLGAEILLALIFGLRAKRAFFTVTAANVVTQILLNLVLNVQLRLNNIYGIFTLYFFAELGVFLAEAALYCFVLGRRKNGENDVSCCGKNEKPLAVYSKKRLILYAFTANLVSFCIGLPLAYLFPSAF